MLSSSPAAMSSCKTDGVRYLSFVGIYWDIATCGPPADQSALRVAQGLQCQFANQLNSHESATITEVEFKVFGDPMSASSAQEYAESVHQLQQAQVEVVSLPVAELASKFSQALQRFVNTYCVQPEEGDNWEHRSKPKLILVSSDEVLLQVLEAITAPENVYPARVVCVNHDGSCTFAGKEKSSWFTNPVENYTFEQVLKYAFNLTKPLTKRTLSSSSSSSSTSGVTSAPQWHDIYIHNLPLSPTNPAQVRQQVHHLVDACGGRLVSIGQGLAVVRFNGGYEYAKWAKKRLDGEEVFGSRIFVKIPFLDANAHKDASPDLSDYCLPKDPEEEWHPTRYLRHQLSSSSSQSSSSSSAAGLSSAVNMATRILSSSSGISSGSRSSIGSIGNSPSIRCSSSSGGLTGGSISGSSCALNNDNQGSANLGGDTMMDFSPSPLSPELDLWHPSDANNSYNNGTFNSSAGSAHSQPRHYQHQPTQQLHHHRRQSTSAFDQSFESIVKQHHTSASAAPSARHQPQPQQQQQQQSKEHFFQNLYVNEIKKSQELMQQQKQQKERKPSLPHAFSPDTSGSSRHGFSTPPAFALTPPLMAPKKAQSYFSRINPHTLSSIRRQLHFDSSREDSPGGGSGVVAAGVHDAADWRREISGPQNFPLGYSPQFSGAATTSGARSSVSSATDGSNQSPRPIIRRNLFRDSPSPEPHNSSMSPPPGDANAKNYAELTVTNLDYNISTKEWKKILFTIFKQHVQVLRVDVITAGDGSSVGSVRVPTVDDARLAISQLHRHKVGYKRIHVNLLPVGGNSRHPALENAKLRSNVVELLSEEHSGGNVKSLPLFKFIDAFEARFHHTISVSDLFKMRDLVEIVENSNGRTVHLLPGITSASHGQTIVRGMEEEGGDVGPDSPFCPLHSTGAAVNECNGSAHDAEKMEDDSVASAATSHANVSSATTSNSFVAAGFSFVAGPVNTCDLMLPNVSLSFKEFVPRVHLMLEAHNGQMPLLSFLDCYNAAYAMAGLEIVSTVPSTESLTASPSNSPSPMETSSKVEKAAIGVPLEHLIASVPGVAISWSSKAIKKIHWCENVRGLASANISCDSSSAVASTNGSLSGDSSLNSSFSAPDVSSTSLTPASVDASFKASKLLSSAGGGPNLNSTSPYIHSQLQQFSREVVDLLKNSPHCRLPFTKFIPEYHHHFGRQCRVADYGYTKLIELFEAIPHIMQVMGSGNHKVVTLTHRSQMKRFTNDVLRILKSQACKQISLGEFPMTYAKIFGRNFDVTDYGMCNVIDALLELPEGTIVMYQSPDSDVGAPSSHPDSFGAYPSPSPAPATSSCSSSSSSSMDVALTSCWLSLPKREQTPEEMARTRQFGREVVELLRHNPRCRLSFNKFIPSYHHHFGRQCRVADYGFTKLIELLEALPDVVSVRDEGEDRFLQLTQKELVAILANQVATIVANAPHQRLLLSSFMPTYNRNHGHPLNLQDDFEVEDAPQLLELISNVVTVERFGSEAYVVLTDRSKVLAAAARLTMLLLEHLDDAVSSEELKKKYELTFGMKVNMIQVLREMANYVHVLPTEGDVNTVAGNVGLPPNATPSDSLRVSLCPLQLFAKTIRNFLMKQTNLSRSGSNCISLDALEKIYLAGMKNGSIPEELLRLGYASITSLLQAIPHVVTLKGQHSNRFVMLQPNLLAKLESMMQAPDERSAYLLSGDAGPQIINRQSGVGGGFQLPSIRETSKGSSLSLKRTPESNRYGNSPYTKQRSSMTSPSPSSHNLSLNESFNLATNRAYNLAASSSRNNFVASSNVFCKQGAPPVPPCTLYPPPPPPSSYHPLFQKAPMVDQAMAASAVPAGLKDLSTPPSVPSWRRHDNAAAAGVVGGNCFAGANLANNGSAVKNGCFAPAPVAAPFSSSSTRPSKSIHFAGVAAAASSSPLTAVASAAVSGSATPRTSNAASSSAGCDVFELIRQMEQASVQQRSASSSSVVAAAAAAAAVVAPPAVDAALLPSSATPAGSNVASTSTLDNPSLLFEPNTLNPNFVHSGPAGGLLTPTMFVDNHFQYASTSSSSLGGGGGESAAAALSQLVQPHLGLEASSPSTMTGSHSASPATMMQNNRFPTPPPSSNAHGESSTFAAGLRRGMAEMFSASAANQPRAQQLQLQQHQQEKLPIQPPTAQHQQSVKPAVELPEVLASLLAKCPSNNLPPTPMASTPAVGSSKPFSFAQTFGQWFPNATSSGDGQQLGYANGNGNNVSSIAGALDVNHNVSSSAITTTDNPIFNTLLTLTATVPPAQSVVGPDFQVSTSRKDNNNNNNDSGSATQKDAKRY